MKKLAFNISARTAKLIGQENFANAEGAIIELVKNCYDADATVCIVYFKQSQNSIYIIDDGDGMTEEIIKNYWMTIGTGNKSLVATTTGKSRVKTGAKGIGRFALDRLGQHCRMLTTTENSKPIEWKMSWNQFDNAVNLTDVTATIQAMPDVDYKKAVADELASFELPKDFFDKHFIKKSGTNVQVSILRDEWEEEEISELFQNLEQLIPPLETSAYSIYVFSEDQAINFGKVEPSPFEEFDYSGFANS